jgi:serine/threonine-protein kinase HipA
VLLGGVPAGVLSRSGRGDLRLEYDPDWRQAEGAYPLSLSMPLTASVHTDRVVRPFLEGLLPDDDGWRKQIARRYQVSARDPFALLAHAGEDCAGAVQFVRPDRLEAILTGEEGEDLEWLSEEEIGRDLRDRVEGRLVGRGPRSESGNFSLAGAQPKLVFVSRGGRWARSRGRTPSTHILKPPAIRELTGLEYNEHFCLRLAEAVGLSAADSEVRAFDGQPAIVVRRFDREDLDGRLVRIHQEDLCQALAVHPDQKYEKDGGPGVAALIGLIREQSSIPDWDTVSFVDAVVFNWVIGGTDAHAKNYSFLVRPGPRITLAPLYDVISMLGDVTRPMERSKLRLAMRVGKKYQLGRIDAGHWRDLATAAGLDPEPLVERVLWMVEEIRDAVTPTVEHLREEGVDHLVIDQLGSGILNHTEACLRQLSRRRSQVAPVPMVATPAAD